MNEATIIQTAIWVAAGATLFIFLKRRRSKRAPR